MDKWDWPIIVAWATLIVTIVAGVVALIAYRSQIKMIEPWKMEKIGDNLWLLERTYPKLATLTAITDDNNHDTIAFHFFPAGTVPAKYFRKGTSILIHIEGEVGQSFNLHYRNHWRETDERSIPKFHLKVRLKDYEKFSPKVKAWKTTLY